MEKTRLTQELFMNDLLFVLKNKLEECAKNKDVVVISDFDETMASNYAFSKHKLWNTHIPKIEDALCKEAQKLNIPLCLATARAAYEPVTWVIWHKLSREPMPVVTENGAVLFWPGNKLRDDPIKIEVLATSDQIRMIDNIRDGLLNGGLNKLSVPLEHEVLFRPNRIATIELRAENKITKKGTPEDYELIERQLSIMFPEILNEFEIVSSGSSLGIQPKGIDKGFGISRALEIVNIDTDKVYFIGLGDNLNDKNLFDFVSTHGGMTIGVRATTRYLVDSMVDGGDGVSLNVLTTINTWKDE